jgi:hypothetical protein
MSAEIAPRYEEQMYGPCPVGADPRAFWPDPECSTDAEREAHRVACEAWERGERPSVDGPLCTLGGATYAFGLGVLTFTVSAEEREYMDAPAPHDGELQTWLDALLGGALDEDGGNRG